MIVLGSASHAEKRRRQVVVEGNVFYKSEWLETDQDPILSPTVFMVEQPPDTTLYAHFHAENQFQVFVEGEGRIGSHAIRAVTVHYAGAYTGYGPLISGPEGLSYFTIRSVFETGTMPVTDRSKMVRGPKRHFSTDPMPLAGAETIAALAAVETQDLIPLQPDGISARVLRLPPGAQASGIDPATGGGQFHVVLNGGLLHEKTELGRWESLFVSSDEKPYIITAGAAGLEVLCLQLAPKDPVYVEAKRNAMSPPPVGMPKGDLAP
ncbi:MAG: hypothetical protein V4632_14760 [Pseudomonadota bacterium]